MVDAEEIAILVELKVEVVVKLYVISLALFAYLGDESVRIICLYIREDCCRDNCIRHLAHVAVDICPFALFVEIDFHAAVHFDVILFAKEVIALHFNIKHLTIREMGL